jgi:DNA-binding NtrC family response regulator
VVLMALVLAINGETDSLALTERVLDGEGYLVAAFEKVREALGWLGNHTPDLVVASGGRHGERAKETVHLLKQAGVAGSRILLLTSADSLASTRNALGHAVRAVMQETADLEELLGLVNSALSPERRDSGCGSR